MVELIRATGRRGSVQITQRVENDIFVCFDCGLVITSILYSVITEFDEVGIGGHYEVSAIVERCAVGTIAIAIVSGLNLTKKWMSEAAYELERFSIIYANLVGHGRRDEQFPGPEVTLILRVVIYADGGYRFTHDHRWMVAGIWSDLHEERLLCTATLAISDCERHVVHADLRTRRTPNQDARSFIDRHPLRLNL